MGKVLKIVGVIGTITMLVNLAMTTDYFEKECNKKDKELRDLEYINVNAEEHSILLETDNKYYRKELKRKIEEETELNEANIELIQKVRDLENDVHLKEKLIEELGGNV